MKTLFPVVALTLLSACSSTSGEGSSASRDADETRAFTAVDFEGVTLAGSDDVRIIIGKAFSVKAVGTQKVLDALEISVENGVLKVARKSGSGSHFSWSGKGDRSAIVTVTMPLIRNAGITGSGDMDIAATAADRFEGSIAGSGNMRIASVSAAQTLLSVAGSGDLSALGTAKNLDLNLAGSGDIDASKLSSVDLSVSVAGSGDVRANAIGKARVSLVGSGDVAISGTKACAISKIGSGDVRCST